MLAPGAIPNPLNRPVQSPLIQGHIKNDLKFFCNEIQGSFRNNLRYACQGNFISQYVFPFDFSMTSGYLLLDKTSLYKATWKGCSGTLYAYALPDSRN